MLNSEYFTKIIFLGVPPSLGKIVNKPAAAVDIRFHQLDPLGDKAHQQVNKIPLNVCIFLQEEQ